MLRLERCDCIDSAELIYSLPPEGRVKAVFDGSVCLDGVSQPKIDEIGGRLKLARPPAFDVTVLVRI